MSRPWFRPLLVSCALCACDEAEAPKPTSHAEATTAEPLPPLPPSEAPARKGAFEPPNLEGSRLLSFRVGAPCERDDRDDRNLPPIPLSREDREWAARSGPHYTESCCSARGITVGAFARVNEVQFPPEDATVLMAGEWPKIALDDRLPAKPSLHAAVSSDWLWINRVLCENCEVRRGWSFIGYLPELLDDDLRRLQARLDLPQEPVLRTAEALRAAFVAARHTESPQEARNSHSPVFVHPPADPNDMFGDDRWHP